MYIYISIEILYKNFIPHFKQQKKKKKKQKNIDYVLQREN